MITQTTRARARRRRRRHFVEWPFRVVVLCGIFIHVDVRRYGVFSSSSSSAYDTASTPMNAEPTPNNNSSNSNPISPALQIGIDLVGQIRCLLWSPIDHYDDHRQMSRTQPTAMTTSSTTATTITPLPSIIVDSSSSPSSSSSSLSSVRHSHLQPSKPLVPLLRTSSSSVIQSTSNSPFFFSGIRPDGIFATLNYRVSQTQKKNKNKDPNKNDNNHDPQSSHSVPVPPTPSSWYGIERLGTILCWRRRRRRTKRNRNQTLNRSMIPSDSSSDSSSSISSTSGSKRKRCNPFFMSLPTSIDVSLERTLPIQRDSSSSSSVSSSSSLLPIDPPIIDIAGIRLGWDHNNNQNDRGDGGRKQQGEISKDDEYDDEYDDDHADYINSQYLQPTPIVHIQVDGSRSIQPSVATSSSFSKPSVSSSSSSSLQSQPDSSPMKQHEHHEQKDLHKPTSNNKLWPLISTGFYVPFGRRFDLQWISHWDFNTNKGRHHQRLEKDQNRRFNDHKSSTKHSNGINPDWWIPRISVDPLGSLSSENRLCTFIGSIHNDEHSENNATDADTIRQNYNNYDDSTYYHRYGDASSSSNYHHRYMIDVKLRVRTQVSVLAFAAPNFASGGVGLASYGGNDDDDDYYDGDGSSAGFGGASIQLDVSLHDCQYHQSMTGRVDASVLLSNLLYSLKNTACLSLLHERTVRLGGTS